MPLKKNNKIRIIAHTIVIAATLTLLLALYVFIRDFRAYKEINISAEELIKDVITRAKENETIKIDWEKLETINKDIIGWIKIENTNINYPIIKDNNNLKYLTYSYEGKYNVNGSIITLNENPFNDSITTIYGHNMKSDIMFSQLEKYMNEKFLKENSSFEIYTKTQNYKATIFACYSINVYDEENNIKSLDFNEEIEYYKKTSKFNVNCDTSEIKKIVKLSTCSYLNNRTVPTEERYYIVAKLEKND